MKMTQNHIPAPIMLLDKADVEKHTNAKSMPITLFI
jgi:hypothetical protein